MESNDELNDNSRTELPKEVTDENGKKRPLKGPFMAYKYQSEAAGGIIKRFFEFFHVDDYMLNQTQVIYENYTKIEHDQLTDGKWIEVGHIFNST